MFGSWIEAIQSGPADATPLPRLESHGVTVNAREGVRRRGGRRLASGNAWHLSLWTSYTSPMATPTIADYAAHLPESWRSRADLSPESTRHTMRGHDAHILRRRSASAPTRLVLIHGAGGHSGALWPLASLVPADVADLAAPDLPLYGDTCSPEPGDVRYDDWVDLLADFLAAGDDGRPLVLLGGSLGGMLAYEAAARTSLASHVVATCLLNPQDAHVRAAITRLGFLAAPAPLMARLVPKAVEGIEVPMGWVAPLDKMSRSAALSRLCAEDRRGGGAHVPLGFLTSFLEFKHTPGARMKTPVTLTAPAADTWTPPSLSGPWLTEIAAGTRTVPLAECGHFPIEEPGLTTLVETLTEVCQGVAVNG